jgi:Leucine-rich repeat (LRR) protein
LLGLVGLLVVLMRTPGAAPPDTAPAVVAPKETGRHRETVDDRWVSATAALPPEKQVEAVVAKLKELNPGYNGSVNPMIVGGIVTELRLGADGLTNIAPLRALTGLQGLELKGTPGKCQFADLSPLKGLRLSFLRCPHTKVADLSPLQGMPLTILNCGGTPVADLSPLAELPLTELNCDRCPVKDLGPLRRLPLAHLGIHDSKVTDLSPLQNMRLKGLVIGPSPVAGLSPLEGMPLESLDCSGSGVTDLSPLRATAITSLDCKGKGVTDLSPLKGLPLEAIDCDFSAWRNDEAVLRPIATLKTINGKPAAEFWKDVDQKKP